MTVELNEKVSEIVKETAKTLGMTPDAVVEQIVKWYVEECNHE